MSAYRMRNVGLFRNYLSALKYGYKRTCLAHPPLCSLFFFTRILSSFPILFKARHSLYYIKARCVVSFHFQGASFRFIFQGRSFHFISKVRHFFQQPRYVFLLFQGRSFLSISKGRSFLFSKVRRLFSASRCVVSF